MDGIINVYKEKGFTSHDVVAKLRGILHQKKIGHTGTLDPEATGVLPICCGKATKVCDLLTDKDKSYRAVCQLGVETDTQDMTGSILEEKDYSHIDEETLKNYIREFEGEIEQIPPMYSALKVNGKKLYELAREGKTVERKARNIKIYKIEIVNVDLKKGQFTMDVTCSKGTYIRTLCHDIGKKLGVNGAMAELERTRVSIFTLEEALTLDQIAKSLEENPEQFMNQVHRVDSLFPQYDRYKILPQYAKNLDNGNRLEPEWLVKVDEGNGKKQPWPVPCILVYDEKGDFKAVYQIEEPTYKVYKMF